MGVCSVRPDQLAHVLLSGAALLRGCRPRYHRGMPCHATPRHAMPATGPDCAARRSSARLLCGSAQATGTASVSSRHCAQARTERPVHVARIHPQTWFRSVGICAAGRTQRTTDVVSDERIGAHRGGPVCGVAHRRAAVRLIGGYGAAAHSLHDCARNQPSVREPNGLSGVLV